MLDKTIVKILSLYIFISSEKESVTKYETKKDSK